jgi:transcriptional regulator with XRE-family HTH domain
MIRQVRSQSELARYAGVDKAVISRFVRGERSMTLDTADRILKAMGCFRLTISKRGYSTEFVQVDRGRRPRVPIDNSTAQAKPSRRRQGRGGD